MMMVVFHCSEQKTGQIIFPFLMFFMHHGSDLTPNLPTFLNQLHLKVSHHLQTKSASI